MIESKSWYNNDNAYLFSTVTSIFEVRSSSIYLTIAVLNSILSKVSISLDEVFLCRAI